MLRSLTCCLSGKAGLWSFGPPAETASDDERKQQLKVVATTSARLRGRQRRTHCRLAGQGTVVPSWAGSELWGRTRGSQLCERRLGHENPPHVQMAFLGWKISL